MLFDIRGDRTNSFDYITLFEEKIKTLRPDGLSVHLGGNDLGNPNKNTERSLRTMFSSHCSLAEIKSEIKSEQLIPRFTTRHLVTDLYNDSVITLNRNLKEELKNKKTTQTYWNPTGLKNPEMPIYLDGLHLNNAGILKYYSNFRDDL